MGRKNAKKRKSIAECNEQLLLNSIGKCKTYEKTQYRLWHHPIMLHFTAPILQNLRSQSLQLLNSGDHAVFDQTLLEPNANTGGKSSFKSFHVSAGPS